MTLEDSVKKGIILGMGNPLLDISATVGEDLLERYKLESNNAILASEEHIPLYEELKSSYKPEYIAGGATQNSIRVAQWLLQSEGATSFFGAVGDDDFASKMSSCVAADGVNAQYQISTETTTGTCAVLINGKNRSLVANLSAANTYTLDHLKESAQWKVVEEAEVYYIAGFFLTVSPDSIATVAAHANGCVGKTFCCNLSAPFLMQVPPFWASMQKTLPAADVVFGNETEARVLSGAYGWGTEDVVEIAKKLAMVPRKDQSGMPRTVVFTQGADPTVVVVGDARRVWSVDKFPIIPIKAEDIIDTNGAGDAFVGGFIAGLAKKCETAECVAMGHYAANVVIQNSGCTFPGKPLYKSSA